MFGRISWSTALCLGLTLSVVPARATGAQGTQGTQGTPSTPSPGTATGSPGTPVAPTGGTPAQTTPASTPAPTPPIRLFMPDGQLVSHSVRVYVEADITIDNAPTLRLIGDNAAITRSPNDSTPVPAALTENAEKPAAPNEAGGKPVTPNENGEQSPAPEENPNKGEWQPALVAPGQFWTEPNPNVEGAVITRRGTLLLFDLASLEFNAKAMRRLLPVVDWTEGTTPRRAVGRSEVNLGSTLNTALWTLLVVGVAVVAVLLLSWTRSGNPALLLTGVDGHLSLAQAQIACWTIAVGIVVLGYGFVRLTIPEIPTALLVLMGASLVTGGVGFFRDAQNQQTAVDKTGVVPEKRSWGLADLIRTFPPTPNVPPELSLAKAQMLFWTVLLIVLFVSKSVLDGNIWSVPWPLVALMGFSQASFLAPKLAPPQTPPPAGGQQPGGQQPPLPNP